MVTCCFVPGCKTGLLTDRKEKKRKGEKMPSLFTPPKDPQLFEQWKKSIPRADRLLRLNDTVCEKHFKEEDIIRYDKVKLFDGSIFRSKRDRQSLRIGAIPCIFSSVPGHSTYNKRIDLPLKKKSYRKRKEVSSKENTVLAKKGKKEVNTSIDLVEHLEDETISLVMPPLHTVEYNLLFEPSDNTDIKCHEAKTMFDSSINTVPFTNDSSSIFSSSFISSSSNTEFLKETEISSEYQTEVLSTVLEKQVFTDNSVQDPEIVLPQSVMEEQFSFNFLRININMIKVYNSWWGVNALENFIIFARWTAEYVVERKIVITKDLNIKVFLKDRETSIGKDLKELSIDSISHLIYRVENTTICNGIDNKEVNCSGFLESVVQCKRRKLCLNCIQWEKLKKKEGKKEKKPNNQIELLRFHFNI